MEMIENVSEDFHLPQPTTVTYQAARWVGSSRDIQVRTEIENLAAIFKVTDADFQWTASLENTP